jgi:hypothetical protein
MVTDSRWTKYFDSSLTQCEDVGTKLFPLTNHSAAIYAGDVISGEHCIKELQRKLSKSKNQSFKASLYTAQQTFRDVYKYHKRTSKKNLFDLFIMIGVCDRIGVASLMYFSSPSFKPIYVEGIYGIGVREAFVNLKVEIEKELDLKINEEFELRAKISRELNNMSPPSVTQNNLIHVAMAITAVMHNEIIVKGADASIGGPLQLALIDSKGVSMPTISWTKDPTETTDAWHQATPKPSEITTYQDKYKLGPSFISSSSFGVHNLN